MNSIHLFGLGGAELLVIGIILSALLVMAAVPAVLAFIVLNRVPPPCRTQTPGLAFLLLIPLFSLVWMFFVHPKVASSLQNYSEANGVLSHGDCGANLALWLCICAVCEIIPGVGILSGIAALVLLIIFYVKAFEISSSIARKIQRDVAQSPS
jgi:divalent metal cation (Fe/Co/Zn/Cd) transporter